MCLFGVAFGVAFAPPVALLLPVAGWLAIQGWQFRLLESVARYLGRVTGGRHWDGIANFLGSLAAVLLRVAAWVWRPGDRIYDWFEVRGLTMILALERSRQGVTNDREPRTPFPASKDHAGQAAAAESPEMGAGRADGE